MSGFSNPIAAGDGTLLVDAIKSPNYVLGASGWSINADGTAEFNDVTVRGDFEVVMLPSGAYMKMIPLAFAPGLVWNPAPALFNVDGSLTVERNILGTKAKTRIQTAADAGTVLPEISIESGATGTADGGVIVISAATVSLSATKQTWVPVWTSTGVAPAFGNANVNAVWWDYGPLIEFRLRIIFGSTTTFGTGNYSFTLPVAPVSILQTMNALAIDNSAATRWPGSAQLGSGGITRLTFSPGTTGMSNVNPLPWAQDDTLIVQGRYEI